jgi:hypothetical protein
MTANAVLVVVAAIAAVIFGLIGFGALLWQKPARSFFVVAGLCLAVAVSTVVLR